LAGNVEFEALGDIPPPLAPNGSRKWSLHDLIVSQARALRTAARVPTAPSQIRSLTAPRALLASMVGASRMRTSRAFEGPLPGLRVSRPSGLVVFRRIPKRCATSGGRPLAPPLWD
jgi:hypothetical protein